MGNYFGLVPVPACNFFFCKRGLPSRDISANHMARILSTSYMSHTRTVNVCAMLMIDLRHLKICAIWLAEISRDGNPRLQKKKSLPAYTCITYFTGCVTAPILKSNCDQKPETFILALVKHTDYVCKVVINPFWWFSLWHILHTLCNFIMEILLLFNRRIDRRIVDGKLSYTINGKVQ